MAISVRVNPIRGTNLELAAKANKTVAAVAKATKDHVDNVVIPRLQVYPGATRRRNAKGRFARGGYKRTFRLRAGWRSRISAQSNTASVQIYNLVRDKYGRQYAHWVQDEEMQASMHVGRWQTVQGVLRATHGDLVNAVRRVIERGG